VRALALLALLVACGPADAPKAAPAPAPSDKPQSPEPPKKAEPFAEPKLTPPPPPDGAALLPDRKKPIYVQKCDKAHSCPDLLQPAGETHCRELSLGGREHWRLPDQEEVKRFGEVAGLELADGFHWTRTADPENAQMAWIVDPKSGQETTIPRTRKPFRIRCVFDP
jgi:hypothetical protein